MYVNKKCTKTSKLFFLQTCAKQPIFKPFLNVFPRSFFGVDLNHLLHIVIYELLSKKCKYRDYARKRQEDKTQRDPLRKEKSPK